MSLSKSYSLITSAASESELYSRGFVKSSVTAVVTGEEVVVAA